VWLNGAPGSGKGANQNHILQTRGLEDCICMSDLLVGGGGEEGQERERVCMRVRARGK
jgi:hypothetical protein